MKLSNILNGITDYYSPKIIGEVNDVFVKLVKIKGAKVPWHNHKEEDELFYIIKGTLLFEVENETPFELHEGDLYIVKRGVNHRVSSDQECHIMLIENKSALHTGDIDSEITKAIDKQY